MIKKIISYVLVLVILGFLFFNISRNWDTIISFPWHFRRLNLLLFSLFLMPMFVVNATSWHLLTKALGFNISYSKNLKNWLYSNLSRLIPGAIWQYATRLYLTQTEGVSKSLVTAALGIEVVFNLTAGLLTIIISIIFWGLPVVKDRTLLFLIIACFLILIILLLKNKYLLNKLISVINQFNKNQVQSIEISLPLRWIPILLCSYLLQFILGGSVLFFLSELVVELPFNIYPLFIGLFAAGWLMGYISIFSPGGLGVQELSLAGLLSIYIPFSIAVIIVIVYRFLILVMEVITISIVYLLQKVRINRL